MPGAGARSQVREAGLYLQHCKSLGGPDYVKRMHCTSSHAKTVVGFLEGTDAMLQPSGCLRYPTLTPLARRKMLLQAAKNTRTIHRKPFVPLILPTVQWERILASANGELRAIHHVHAVIEVLGSCPF